MKLKTALPARFSCLRFQAIGSQFRQHDSRLPLVLALLVLVADFARLVPEEEQDLTKSLIRIDAGWQGSGVGNFQRHEALPLRLERRHVDDDPAACIG